MNGVVHRVDRGVLRRSEVWFSEGAQLKRQARRHRHCVECFRSLPSRRSPYCSRNCAWRFRGRFFWDAARSYVLKRDRYTCQGCRRRMYAHDLEVDHILELALGGAPLAYENLQTLCKPCHRKKTVSFLRVRRTPTQSLSFEEERAGPLETENPPEWFPA
jgi:5-methylcytosine-specific restriction endonuclease McrA